MDHMIEPRYFVEQLGYSDFGVWDNEDDRWVFDGSKEDCEDRADRLNENKGGCDEAEERP